MSLLDHRSSGRADAAASDAGERRRLHFVGSLPPELAGTDREGMQWLLDRADPAQLTGCLCRLVVAPLFRRVLAPGQGVGRGTREHSAAGFPVGFGPTLVG